MWKGQGWESKQARRGPVGGPGGPILILDSFAVFQAPVTGSLSFQTHSVFDLVKAFCSQSLTSLTPCCCPGLNNEGRILRKGRGPLLFCPYMVWRICLILQTCAQNTLLRNRATKIASHFLHRGCGLNRVLNQQSSVWPSTDHRHQAARFERAIHSYSPRERLLLQMRSMACTYKWNYLLRCCPVGVFFKEMNLQ